jgi:hypothetical protein
MHTSTGAPAWKPLQETVFIGESRQSGGAARRAPRSAEIEAAR